MRAVSGGRLQEAVVLSHGILELTDGIERRAVVLKAADVPHAKAAIDYV